MTLPIRVWAVDPGVRYYAWAAAAAPFYTITHVGYETEIEPPPALGEVPGHLIIEKPQAYPDERVPAQDLIDLAWSAGRISAWSSSVWIYLPREWKGQIPKKIHQARILKALRPPELALLAGLPKYKSKDVIDACGLLLTVVGRM